MPQPLRRRQALVVIGSPVAAPLFKHLHPALPQQEGEWKPRFFEPAELEAVTALAERIIPETDTPGARRALVHQYVDFVLAHGEPVEGTPASGEPAQAEADLERPRPSPRERFRAGLLWLDRRATALFGKPFAQLSPAQQDELLTRLAERPSREEPEGVAFFVLARRLTIDGYYRSEAGMVQELGFEGRTFLAEFPGCTHPQHHAYRIEAGAQTAVANASVAFASAGIAGAGSASGGPASQCGVDEAEAGRGVAGGESGTHAGGSAGDSLPASGGRP